MLISGSTHQPGETKMKYHQMIIVTTISELLRVQGFKGSSDQGRTSSQLLSNPGILDPSNPCSAKDQTEVFAER
jgi:hypothetical protein